MCIHHVCVDVFMCTCMCLGACIDHVCVYMCMCKGWFCVGVCFGVVVVFCVYMSVSTCITPSDSM